MNKEQLRAKYKQLRHKIPHKAKKSDVIWQTLKTLPCYRQAAVVAFYASLPDEVDTAPMIREALSGGKRVCLPKVEGESLTFYELTRQSVMQKGVFGIAEPVGGARVAEERIDIAIVPLLAADANNCRLGFGGGYYDRFLAGFHGISIGICFSEQITPEPLPHEAHDVPLSMFISEKGLKKQTE